MIASHVAIAQKPASPQPTETDGSAASTPNVFVGYVNGRAADLNYSLYTHLCHAFVTVEANGRITPNQRVPDARFVEAAHRHGVRVLLSVGGWGWDEQFAAIVQDAAAEDRFVSGVLKAVRDAKYDGIDLDWEYPDTATEIVGFERLTRRLRAGLDEIASASGSRKELTMAASANPATLAWLTNEFLLETMDWVNVMTYDYAGSWTGYAGHNAPFRRSDRAPQQAGSVLHTLEHLLDERGFPPERLALGLPLYGRAFSTTEPYAPTEGTERPGRSATYSDVVRLIDAGWTRSWDSQSESPWLRAPSGDEVLGYDDVESIRLKTRWAKRRGLRGVFFWEVKHDRLASGGNPLQEVARQAWQTTPGGRDVFERRAADE